MDVRSNIDEVARSLDIFQERQLPFATAGALTATAFAVRETLVGVTFPRDFDLKNKRWPSVAFRVLKASKSSLVAAVFDRLGRGSIGLHISGGTKRPKGRNLAIPQAAVGRTKGGAVRSGQRPRALQGRRDVFLADLSGQGPAIWQRRDGNLVKLYELTPEAKIKRRLRFYEDAHGTVRRVFPIEFDRALARALASAF